MHLYRFTSSSWSWERSPRQRSTRKHADTAPGPAGIWGEGKQRKNGVHTANSSHRTSESNRTPSSATSPWSHSTDTWSHLMGTWSLPRDIWSHPMGTWSLLRDTWSRRRDTWSRSWEHLIHRQETPRPPPSSRYAISRLTLTSAASS